MTRQVIGALTIGVTGVAILLWLGIWQLQRLGWKQAILTDIEHRISAPARPIAAAPHPVNDAFQPVEEFGVLEAFEIHVLASRKQIGAGYRIIAPFRVGDRRFLLDRGFVPTTDNSIHFTSKLTQITVIGNLHWPDEIDSYTPPPDSEANIWFARDIKAMAKFLDTEPILIVARSDTGDGVEPYPVNANGIPNDHLNYAITWFSLAAVWLGMTLYLLWRIKRQTA